MIDAIELMRAAMAAHQEYDAAAFIPMAEMQAYAAVAQAEALNRIADALDEMNQRGFDALEIQLRQISGNP